MSLVHQKQVDYCLVKKEQKKFLKDKKSYLMKSVSPSISHWYVILKSEKRKTSEVSLNPEKRYENHLNRVSEVISVIRRQQVQKEKPNG